MDQSVATAHSILQGMGWHWQTPGLFTRDARPHVGLLDGPESCKDCVLPNGEKQVTDAAT